MSLNEEIKITEDGGVIKKILQLGEGEEVPPQNANVQVTYIGTLVDGGNQFDANTDKENPFEFKVGVGQVIKGWDLGMITMKKGERALFTIQHEYAYGEAGSGPTIPPKAALNFEVEMLGWGLDKGDHAPQDRFTYAAEAKAQGTEYFKQGKYEDAIQQYDEANEWLETMYDNEQAIKEQIPVRNNLAMCHLKLKNFDQVIKYTTLIIEKEPSNVKALFRRGQAYSGNGEFVLAKQDLKCAYDLDKSNATAKELQLVQQKIKAQKNKEKQQFQQMFSKNLYNDKEDVKVSKIVSNPSDPSNPKVFMDIKIGDNEPERLEIELYKNVVPKTADNFLELCKTKYKDTIFHRNIKNFMIQGGDYENRNGTGGKSIYGAKFEDENFNVLHSKRGQLSMANAGPNTNGSQFFILYTNTPHLDGKHVVFGEVTKNIELLDKLENAETGQQDKPVQDIVIVDSGVLE